MGGLDLRVLQSLMIHCLQRSDMVSPFNTTTFLFITSHVGGSVLSALQIPSKIVIDPEEHSLGYIRAGSVAPPHSRTSRQCILRVGNNPGLAWHGDLFADALCAILNWNKARSHSFVLMAQAWVQFRQWLLFKVKLLINHGWGWGVCHLKIEQRTFIGTREWWRHQDCLFFWPHLMNYAKKNSWSSILKCSEDNFLLKWAITRVTNGYISIRSESKCTPSLPWAGTEIVGSTVPVSWRLILADSKSFYWVWLFQLIFRLRYSVIYHTVFFFSISLQTWILCLRIY
jgi:hypothetical protein